MSDLMQTTVQNDLRGRVRAARFSGAEAGISLSKRRIWFAPKTPPVDPVDDEDDEEDEDDAEPAEGTPEWFAKNPAKGYAALQKLRRENAKLRVDGKGGDPKPTPEAQTVEQRMAQLEADLKASNRRAIVAEVAAEMGLTVKQASRLHGDTRDEIMADAEDLIESFPPARTKGKGGTKPKDGDDVDDASDDDDDVEDTPPPKKPRRTTVVPDGKPVGETDAQKRARLYGGSSSAFDGGGVTYMGDARDLDGPVG